MAATDRLDGWLARRWNQVTRLGSLLDPAADKILITASVALLSISRFAPTSLAIPRPLMIGIYLKDVGVMIGIAVVVRITGHVKLAARPTGKWSTVSQLMLVMTTLLMPEAIAVSWYWAATLMWSVWYATLAATAAAAGLLFDRGRSSTAGARGDPNHNAERPRRRFFVRRLIRT